MRSIILMILVSALCGFKTSADLNANDVLKRMADKLNKIGPLQYDYTREISYPSENYKASTIEAEIDAVIEQEEAKAPSH